jgi:hypothetical protein
MVTASAQGGTYVFKAERLDAEERSETEPLIPGVGPQEEHPHATFPRARHHLSEVRPLCKTMK